MSRLKVDQLATLVLLGVLLAFTLTPLYFLVAVAMAPRSGGVAGFPVPQSLAHFETIVSGNRAFYPYLLDSLVIAGTSTIVCLLIALPSSYGLSRWKSNFSRALNVSIFSFRMIPPIIFVIPYYLFVSNANLLDTRFGIILPVTGVNLPLAVWIMTGFFDGIPISLDEAAAIDGASPLRIFVSIVAPLSSQGVLVTGVLVFIFAYIDYIFALTIGLSEVSTLPVYIASFQHEFRFFVSEMMATAIIGILPLLVLYTFVQPYFKKMSLAGA